MCKNTWVSCIPIGLILCLKFFRKSIIRGALTNGQDWIFILLKMNADGNGGMYAVSEEHPVVLVTFTGKTIEKPWCSTIAGIIAHWVSDFVPSLLPLLTFGPTNS
jgi:hypothetical protein